MFKWLKKLVQQQTCAFCHNKLERSQDYINDVEETISVCYKCVPYAERRAFRKK
ncbi:hypothetical protein [Aquibacillus sediminis]|uniref:hypothetical protein n=1 Tax=Aquibacillus sediminis TaxID=2574734 RepID=UPI001486D64C|nr:hypothetical protein [Aquibacillus sediminis]